MALHQCRRGCCAAALALTTIQNSQGFHACIQRPIYRDLSSSARYVTSQSQPDTTNERANVIASCQALGGDLTRIVMEGEGDGFLAKMSVPTFAAASVSTPTTPTNGSVDENHQQPLPTRLGLEALVPGAFVVRNAVPISDCESIIQTCEDQLKFGRFSAGKNNHGALQILVSDEAAEAVSRAISPHVNLDVLDELPSAETSINNDDEVEDDDVRYTVAGINKRWRVYRYATDGDETFAPHIDAGFPPSDLSVDGKQLIWDATPDNEDIVSRFTVLIYLNEDFSGGQTNFFVSKSEQQQQQGHGFSDDGLELLASVKPKAGSVLIFPQAVGEDAVAYAREHWPLHEGSPVTGGSRPKYVIRSDLLIAKTHGLAENEKDDPLFQYDKLVRQAFMPNSPAVDAKFASHLASLYNPHMGVENAGLVLYSLVRFTKLRRLVEIGAGYTSLWLLQALKDNDDEMRRLSDLKGKGKCQLLDSPWSVPEYVDYYDEGESSLLCVDNCLHQRQTASGAAAVAKNLGLDKYFRFVQGDAYDMQFEPESVDLLWCDFGVGSRMRDFAPGAWRSVRPGGFLVCHSTLTNQGTREWLEDVRTRKEETLTGIPPGEFTELSLLEPQKRYQNSVTILQRRRSGQNDRAYFSEPIYSQYA